MARQYVHLSIDAAMAGQVGKRKAEIPVIMVVDAVEAYEPGVVFYRGNDSVWHADAVPPAFVK